MVAARISDVIINCRDAERLAVFWSQLLGRAIAGRRGPYVWLEEALGEVNLGSDATFEIDDDGRADYLTDGQAVDE